MMCDIRAIILDFDGVLAESNAEKDEAFKELFSLYPDYEQQMMAYHQAWFSTSRMDKFRHYVFELMKRPGDMNRVILMAEEFSNFVMKRIISCPDVPGAREFLAEFSDILSLYISSATPQEELREIVRCRGIETYFAEIYGDPPVKKKEAVYSILKRESAHLDEILFIGDSISDYLVAQETGVRFIGRHSGLPFHDVDIDLCEDLFDVADTVRNLIGNEAK